MPVHVLVLLTADLESAASGGIRTFVRDFVKYSPADFEIDIVGSTADPRARPPGGWRTLTYGARSARFLPLVHIPANASSRVPDLLRYVMALILRRRWLPLAGHVLQVHRPAIALAFPGHRGPIVQWLHLNTVDGIGQLRWRRLPGLFRLLERRTLGRMARVYLPSSASVDDLRRRYPALAERIRFSANWYDTQRFGAPTEAQRTAARDWLATEIGAPLAPTAKVILFVGRLEPVKDPRLLLATFAEHARDDATARLVLIGDGSLRAEIGRQAAALGLAERVHLLGAREPDEVARAMQAADVLLVSSRSEASARVALEALGSGLPVVSTRVGEMAAVVEHGRTGWLADERRAEVLARGLAWAIAQPRDAIAGATSGSVVDNVPERALAAL
ncbi:MAG TPA: glycosyltransferase, partial [Candidatus Limnocylindrales bacterium]